MSNIKISMPTFPSVNSASAFMEATERAQRTADDIGRIVAEREATIRAAAEASVEQRGLMEQQLDILHEQNALLADNYDKLKDLYDDQVQANIDAKAELAKTKRYNAWMMVVSVIAMLAAIVSPFVPLFFDY